MRPSLDIILINWNAGAQLHSCLDSIAAANRQSFNLLNVIVVDNASTDDSVDALERHPLSLKVIRNPENRGFGAACNQGTQHTQGDYLLILNPDVCLYPDTLDRLMAFACQPENQHAGIFSPQLIGNDGQIQRLCARFPTPQYLFLQQLGLDRLFPHRFASHFMVEWDHRQTRQVDQVPGGFFLIRRSLFNQLGGFDERFFMYYEDVDLSLRASQAGWGSIYYAGARAVHTKGGTTAQIKARRLFYFLRSRLFYTRKHFSRRASVVVVLTTLLLEPWARLAFNLAQRSPRAAVETIQGYLLLWRALPHLIARANISRDQ